MAIVELESVDASGIVLDETLADVLQEVSQLRLVIGRHQGLTNAPPCLKLRF
ncbi:hypothetical protein [Candidatus Nephthysia bennettiae]|uniref:Uncharacterized protein n=1 Tax=Candidatus Nephthysia bennettiae TaxID=3127016 RepID=A0A934N7T8_9BACT|nr:hypothetical protein [Candidatus Dormibacteraeota bacterium]